VIVKIKMKNDFFFSNKVKLPSIHQVEKNKKEYYLFQPYISGWRITLVYLLQLSNPNGL